MDGVGHIAVMYRGDVSWRYVDVSWRYVEDEGLEEAVLELAVLGLLKERAMHGYELRKQLTQRLGFLWTVSFGSLYPTLRKMERRGAVEKVRQTETGTRRRQVYRITPAGEREFLELLEEGTSTAWEEDKFPLRLTFFRYLRPETRIRLLEHRKHHLETKLAEGRRTLERAARNRSDTYTLSLVRHGCEVTERDIAWLDELIAAERQSSDPRPAAPVEQVEPAEPPAQAPNDPEEDRTLQTK